MTDDAGADVIRALRGTLVAKERELQSLQDQLAAVTRERDEAVRTASTPAPTPTPAAVSTASPGVVETDDRVVLQEVGIYTYQHPLQNAEQYRERLADVRDRIKQSVISTAAVEASDMFSFNNSLAKGRKMTADLSKLMLRAYNAEAENCVRTLKAGNLATAVNRLEKAAATIAKLGAMMEMHVSNDYHRLRVTELELTADYLMKVQEEKLAQREERERLREERKVEQELAAQRRSSIRSARTIRMWPIRWGIATTTRPGACGKNWRIWSPPLSRTTTAEPAFEPDTSTSSATRARSGRTL